MCVVPQYALLGQLLNSATAFFSAGSTCSPLNVADRLPPGLWIPPVTMVFCKVEMPGGLHLARYEMDRVNSEIIALMATVMRQVCVA